MNPELIVGFVAAFLTTFAFAPQAIHTIRTRNTEGISLSMYLLFVTGVSVWLVYGLMVNDMAITIANVLTFLLALPVLLIKLSHRRSDKDTSHDLDNPARLDRE